jgi:hypothetical protein
MPARFNVSSRLRGLASVVALLGLGFSSLAIARALQPAPSAIGDAAICGPEGTSAKPDEAPYLVQNRAAMTKMMTAMSIEPTGDVDRDFVEMMVPHHQGAIEMAVAVLRYGKNEQLRRLAQEIIVTQQQEIAAMRLALGEPVQPSVASPAGIEALPQPAGPALRQGPAIGK